MKRNTEEVLSYIRDNDVKFIRLAFCDLDGRHKNISIMPSELLAAFEKGISFDHRKLFADVGNAPDNLYLIPDPSTLAVLPWRPQTGRVVRFYCNMFTAEGEPFLYDSRQALKDVLRRCKEAGFSCRIGLRSEFYLFRTDENGNPTDIPHDRGSYLDVAPLDKGENIRREICLSLEEMGIAPEASLHEMGPGQNEIDFAAADALRSADHFMTYRNVVSAIAAKNGVYASFDPLPIRGECGNGLHLKMNLHRAGEDIGRGKPELFDAFMAGVYTHIRDITVFLNPLASSYERFGEGDAPQNISWSHTDASRLFRIPVTADGATDGFILRSPDPSINPYLAFAMILEAGLEGISSGRRLPAEEEKKDRVDAESRRLPSSLTQAVAIAEESTFLRSSALSQIAARYIEQKSACRV